MKTTIEITDGLFRRARQLAKREGITIRKLVEEGLILVLDTRGRRKPVKVEPVTFKGKGLSPDYRDASWSEIRAAAYEGRGT